MPVRVSTVVRADERSGRLVRAVVVMPKLAAAPAPLDLGATVDQIAIEHGVEESLVHSVIRAESNYNPYAVSPKGAQGIMQLIPATARRFGVADTFDPEENIQGGVKYLNAQLRRSCGQKSDGCAAAAGQYGAPYARGAGWNSWIGCGDRNITPVANVSGI
jgi:soluble lytic murein transglycosylase-like protein